MPLKLTKRSIDSLRPDPAGRRRYVFDSELPGFGVVVHPGGLRSFFAQYWSNGEKRRMVLGRYGPLTVEDARRRAREILADVTKGADPARARREAREAPTVAEFGLEYLADVDARRKPKVAYEYRRLWRKHIEPQLGRKRVATVDQGDAAALHRSLRDRPYVANRVLALLSGFFTFAEQQGVRPRGTNPAIGVETFPEVKRERFLTPAELTRLGTAITTAERIGLPPWRNRADAPADTAKHRSKTHGTPSPANPFAVAALRFLLLTGWREHEVLDLLWEHVDLERGFVAQPDTKGGYVDRPLLAPARTLLESLPRVAGSPFVFPGQPRLENGKRVPRPLSTIDALWYAVRHAAGLDSVRLHDLRHTFASTVASGGASLLVIAKLLGHKDKRTTERYAHLLDDPVREAGDAAAAAVAAALDTSPAAVLRRA